MKSRKPTNIHKFKTKREVVRFAKVHVGRRIRGFRKDVEICLTANDKGSHAYLPGLMTCLSFLDHFSGLYAGQVEGHNHRQFLIYAKTFLEPVGQYEQDSLKILYIGFRHKLAHLGHPYFVFDTRRDKHKRFSPPHKRIAWMIYASKRKPPIELYPVPRRQFIRSQPTPRKVYYDHRIKISIRALMTDAIKSARRYLKQLEVDPTLRAKFKACIKEMYSRQ